MRPLSRSDNEVSLPAWGAWIEINTAAVDADAASVAPRVGSVD